jgi:hypothetical protein
VKTPLPPARGIRWLSGSADSSNEGRRSVVETGAGAPFRPEVRPTYFAPSMRSPMFSSTSARPTPISIEAGYANQVPLERQGPIEMTTGRQIYGQPTYGLQSNIPSHMIVPLAQARGIYPMIRASGNPTAAQRDAAEELVLFVNSNMNAGQSFWYETSGRLKFQQPVQSLQRNMGLSGASADGKYGSTTRAKIREILGREAPSLPAFSSTPTGSTPTGSTGEPIAQRAAAVDLRDYITANPGLRNYYNRDGSLLANPRVQELQRQMGGLTADGKYGSTTQARMSALGVTNPPARPAFNRDAWERDTSTPGATPTGSTPTGQQELLQPPEWARATYSPAEWTALGAAQRQTLITQYFQSQRPDVVGQVVQGILQTGQFAVNAYLQYNREERDALLAAAQQQVQNRLNALEQRGPAGAGDEATRALMAQLTGALSALGQARQSGDEQPSRLSPGVIAAIAVGGLVLVGGVIFLATRGGGGGGGGYGYGPPPRYRNNPRKRSRRRGH